MDIEGTYTLQATPEEVWRCLLDHQVLREAIPGVKQLERPDKYTYNITLHVGQPPLTGSYSGQVTVTEEYYPYSYRLMMEGEGRQGTISGRGIVHLSGRGENTVVVYKGTLHIGKLGTLPPPPLIKGTAKLLLQQFFTELAEHLRTLQPTGVEMTQPGSDTLTVNQPPDKKVTLPQPAFLYAIVHALKLGGGDLALEEQWVHRLKRAGVIAGLLLLVWVGTQLPRRPGA